MEGVPNNEDIELTLKSIDLLDFRLDGLKDMINSGELNQEQLKEVGRLIAEFLEDINLTGITFHQDLEDTEE